MRRPSAYNSKLAENIDLLGRTSPIALFSVVGQHRDINFCLKSSFLLTLG